MPSASGLISPCFKAIVEHDSELATQTKSWYDMKSHGAIKQVDPRLASDRRNPRSVYRTYEKSLFRGNAVVFR